eukprot:181536_1
MGCIIAKDPNGAGSSSQLPKAGDKDLKGAAAPGDDVAVRAPDGCERDTWKILLLGSGESGKSTIFKRLLITYGRGYDEADRSEFCDSIHCNIVESIQMLIVHSKSSEDPQCKFDQVALANEVALIDSLTDQDRVTPEIADAITKLWADPGIQNSFELRSSFQIPDSAIYFFEHVKRISQPRFIPELQDVLLCRDRTIGITHEVLPFANPDVNKNFDVYDVGGQKSERRLWIQIFHKTKAVIFVVAISEYDELCFEDEETNRMFDALEVFKMVARARAFSETQLVVLFNKVDLFKEKLRKGLPFTFQNYSGPQEFDAIVDFIKQRFMNEVEEKKRHRVVTRFTCAIDKKFDFTDVFRDMVANARDLEAEKQLQQPDAASPA